MSNAGRTRGGWAAVAAALPQRARAEREQPFWRALVTAWGWGRVVDAGCGSGFHLALLRALGVAAVGFDAALEAIAAPALAGAAAGDLLAPPVRSGTFDAALCLGNTISLLANRRAQRRALAALGRLVRPGGIVLLQGEDAGSLVAGGPLARARRLDGGGVHLRVFERAGRGVRMLAGVVREGAEAALEDASLVPTTPATLARTARGLPLGAVPLPADPPAGAGWWAAFSARSSAP